MDYLFLMFLFMIAFLYSSVGHGGGSGYLALMAIYSITPEYIRSSALILNVFVSIIAFLGYTQAGYFKFKLILPFIITSIPMAYLGGLLKINATSFKIILGIFLLIAVARILFMPKEQKNDIKTPPLLLSLIIGGILGFLSGLIGIGGGIILTPILIIFGWSTIKESAAVSALFIFLNSISGIIALYNTQLQIKPHLYIWIIAVVLGGLAGSYSGSMKLQAQKLKYILAIVLVLASFKLFIY